MAGALWPVLPMKNANQRNKQTTNNKETTKDKEEGKQAKQQQPERQTAKRAPPAAPSQWGTGSENLSERVVHPARIQIRGFSEQGLCNGSSRSGKGSWINSLCHRINAKLHRSCNCVMNH